MRSSVYSLLTFDGRNLITGAGHGSQRDTRRGTFKTVPGTSKRVVTQGFLLHHGHFKDSMSVYKKHLKPTSPFRKVKHSGEGRWLDLRDNGNFLGLLNCTVKCG